MSQDLSLMEDLCTAMADLTMIWNLKLEENLQMMWDLREDLNMNQSLPMIPDLTMILISDLQIKKPDLPMIQDLCMRRDLSLETNLMLKKIKSPNLPESRRKDLNLTAAASIPLTTMMLTMVSGMNALLLQFSEDY